MHKFELGAILESIGQRYKVIKRSYVCNKEHPAVISNPALGRLYTIEAVEKNGCQIGQRKKMNEVLLSRFYWCVSNVHTLSIWEKLEQALEKIDTK